MALVLSSDKSYNVIETLETISAFFDIETIMKTPLCFNVISIFYIEITDS